MSIKNIYINTTGLISPCTKDCEKRCVDCRKTCEQFQDYEKKRLDITRLNTKYLDGEIVTQSSITSRRRYEVDRKNGKRK